MTNVKAGVQMYESYLAGVFPSLESIFYNGSSCKTILDSFSPVKEPMRSLAVQREFLKAVPGKDVKLLLTSGIYGWSIDAKKHSFPVINISHGTFAAFADAAIKRASLEYMRTRFIYSLFERKAALNATAVVANSFFTQENLKKYYGIESTVIHNPIDSSVFKPLLKEECREKLGLPAGKKIVLFVGRPSYAKGFDIFEGTAESCKDILFICVTFPKSAAAVENILALDAVEPSRLNLFYNAADILLFPSRFEGFGFVPLEALACNTPVVSSRVGVFCDTQFVNSIIVDDFSVESFSQAIKSFFESPEKKEYSRERIVNDFSIGNFGKDYLKLVSLLGEKKN